MARVRGMDPPPEYLSLVWPILDPSYEPPGPPPPTIHWTANTAYDLGSVLIEPSAASAPPGLFFKYVCTRAGTTDPTTEPLWPIVGSIIDAGCTWLEREYVPYAPAVARHRAPRRREPPHVPTPTQLAWRAAFTHTTNLAEQAPYNESHCWHRLAQYQGLEWWEKYLQSNLRNVYQGTPDSDILRPLACASDPDWAADIPYVYISNPVPGDLHLYFRANLDPGTHRHHPNERSSAPYTIYHRVQGYNPMGTWTSLWNITPWATLQQYSFLLNFNCPPATVVNRTILFTKQVQELDRECILWDFLTTESPGTLTYKKFVDPLGGNW